MINPAPPQGYDALIVIVCGGVCAYTVLIIERVALEGGPAGTADPTSVVAAGS